MALVATRPTPQIRPVLSLTAAASERKLTGGNALLNIRQEAWQQRMWHFYHNLGVVHYGVNFKKNAASKVRYFAAEIVEGEDEPIETTNQAAIDAVNRLQSRFGGLKQIVAELMVHVNVTGEGYLVGNAGLDGEEWDVWSVLEAQRAELSAAMRLWEPDTATADGDTFGCRIWRPDPEDRAKADSPLRPVAQQCEQLLLLEDSISALAKSRLSAGFWYLPSELDIGDQTEFEDRMIAILTTPIKETDSAARWAPGLIRGPAEYFDKIGPIGEPREIDATFAAMRQELTDSIVDGQDLPMGFGDKGESNHWNIWEIDESAFRDHVDPDITLILDSVTRGYLTPSLIESKEANPKKYLIWRDLSDLGQKPPTIAEGLELHAAGAVNDQYLRDLANVGDEYIPDEEPEPEIVEAPLPIFEPGPPVREDTLVAALKTKPLTELGRIDEGLLERISEATEAAFNRVLERAGAKIRTHAKKDRAISMTIDKLSNDLVTRYLGEKLIMQLQIHPDDLVPDDSFDPLIKRLRSMMDAATLAVIDELDELTGVVPSLDNAKIQAAIGHYTTQLQGFALKLLFNPLEPGPGEVGTTQIPSQMVVDMLTEAGGGIPTTGPSDIRGFATGQDSLNFLSQNGFGLAGHQWDYGDAATRQRPFPPHRRLSGVEFTDWTDERLQTPASASFLNVGHMFPGDHFRCQCRTVPVVIVPQAAA